MNNRTPLHPIDFDQMERDLNEYNKQNQAQPQPQIRAETATQIIAQGIVHLTWKEAEVMGEAIQAKVKDGVSLTSAIQAWAAEWETFK